MSLKSLHSWYTETRIKIRVSDEVTLNSVRDTILASKVSINALSTRDEVLDITFVECASYYEVEKLSNSLLEIVGEEQFEVVSNRTRSVADYPMFQAVTWTHPILVNKLKKLVYEEEGDEVND